MGGAVTPAATSSQPESLLLEVACDCVAQQESAAVHQHHNALHNSGQSNMSPPSPGRDGRQDSRNADDIESRQFGQPSPNKSLCEPPQMLCCLLLLSVRSAHHPTETDPH